MNCTVNITEPHVPISQGRSLCRSSNPAISQEASLTEQRFQAEVILASSLADIQAAKWEKRLEQTQHPLAWMDFLPRGKENSWWNWIRGFWEGK